MPVGKGCVHYFRQRLLYNIDMLIYIYNKVLNSKQLIADKQCTLSSQLSHYGANRSHHIAIILFVKYMQMHTCSQVQEQAYDWRVVCPKSNNQLTCIYFALAKVGQSKNSKLLGPGSYTNVCSYNYSKAILCIATFYTHAMLTSISHT